MVTAKSDNSHAADVIKNWIRSRNTLEFLGTWEQIYNPNFKVVEFDHFKQEVGLHTFALSVTDWVDNTNAVEIYVKGGQYGGRKRPDSPYFHAIASAWSFISFNFS